jgi:hypothetical protein
MNNTYDIGFHVVFDSDNVIDGSSPQFRLLPPGTKLTLGGAEDAL